jgi:DNA-binding HxlR family transcriptional regulator
MEKKSFEPDELSAQFKSVSKAALSRKLSLLRKAGVIKSEDARMGRERTSYSLSALGVHLLNTK